MFAKTQTIQYWKEGRKQHDYVENYDAILMKRYKAEKISNDKVISIICEKLLLIIC